MLLRFLPFIAAAVVALPGAAGPAPGPAADPCRDPGYREFDFRLGDWEIVDPARSGPTPARDRVSAILDGCGILEESAAPDGYAGLGVSRYDPASRSWTRSFIDNRGAALVQSGGSRGGPMVLEGRAGDDAPVQRSTWQRLADGRVRALLEHSTDGGATWVTVTNDTYARRTGMPDRIEARPRTDNRLLGQQLERVAVDLGGEPGNWVFEYGGVKMRLVSDESADRLRIVAPIVEIDTLPPEQILAMLQANFDRAADAKYAVWQGGAWSTYAHPLGELSKAELIGAVRQVAALVRNFGTSYSSSDLGSGAEAD